MAMRGLGTGALRVFSDPLRGESHVPHGTADAALLPAVMELDLQVAPRSTTWTSAWPWERSKPFRLVRSWGNMTLVDSSTA